MNRSLLYIIYASVGLLLAACSTTESIPEGEQLYVGIKRITYETTKSKPTARFKMATDTAGVITAIADAVNTIDQAIKGERKTPRSLAELRQRDPASLSKSEREWIKTQEKAERKTLAAAKQEVEAVLSYAPNGALFGSSSLTTPWKFGLWTYNRYVASHTLFGRWMFRVFAEAPILVSNVAPQTRVKVANNTLHNFGYFRSRVDYELIAQSNPKKAKIAYHVRPGELFHLDSIDYRNFEPIADSLLRLTQRDRLLRRGDAFNTKNLTDEQTRIETLMRNNGFYYYAAAHTTYEADTIAHPGFVQLRVAPDPRRTPAARRPWYIGRTYVNIRNLDHSPLDGELNTADYTFAYPGTIIPLRPGMWRRAIAHRRGARYSLADQKSTFERLYAMGVFSGLDIDYAPRDTAATCDTLDLYINAIMGRAYDAAFEMNATLKSNQQVGPGVSYELSKNNAFRGGETVAWKLFGSYEWQTGGGRNGGNSLLNSFEIGTQLSFKFPRLLVPWSVSGRRRRGYRSAALPQRQQFHLHQQQPVVGSTTFAVNADWRNRSSFFQLVSVGGNLTYRWYRHPRYTHELALLNLEYNRILNTSSAFDSITSANPALFVSMRNQFIPSLDYTFTYRSRASSRHPKWMQFTLKEAGNLLSAAYAAFGQSPTQRDKHLLGSPFAQFVKATAEYRYARTLSPRLRLATRLFAGAVYSYGNSSRAPYSEQFYVGGANSVRAFSVRTVGPGGYYAPGSRYSYIDQTGDFKLEGNVELRAHLFGSLHGAVFLDAGNVWLIKPDPLRPNAALTAANLRRVAVGTGAGLRYDLQFIVLRFDVGIGLHAPYSTGKTGFYNLPKFSDGLAYHFAIGYPF